MKNTKFPVTIFMVLLLMCTFSVSGLMADTYVKGKIYFKSRYAYGVTEPDAHITMEWWLGKQKILFTKASLTNSNDYQTDSPLKIILDREGNRFILMDDKQKSFVSMPQDSRPLQTMTGDAAKRFTNIKCSGWVKTGEKNTGKNASHLNTTCRVVKVNEKVDIQDRVYYDRDRTLLVADKLPFDWKPLARLNLWMRAFFKPSDEYMAQLQRIKGFVMASKDTRYHNGKTITTRFEVLEIKEKEPPKGIYDIPAGYKENKKLATGQVWGIFDTLYPWGW